MDVYQRRRLVALSALAGVFIVIVLLVRSCGGDDSETPQPLAGASGASGTAGATALSQEQYVAQADQVCREINTAISQIDTADANAAADERATDIASELDQLQSLPPPTDGQDQLDKFLQALQDQVDAYEKRTLAVERGDDAAVSELDAKISEAEDAAAAAARKFGFNACGDFSEVSENGGEGGGGGETTTTETETGGAVTPTTTPVAPTPTTEVPAPDTGTAAPETGTAPPETGGTGTGSSGGVTP